MTVGAATVDAPRDNVVFEAGYFAAAKGKTRALIIREDGVTLPSDLDGQIYMSLRDRNRTSDIHASLLAHLVRILDG